MKLELLNSMDDAELRAAWRVMEAASAGMSPFLKLDYVANVFSYARLCDPAQRSVVAVARDDDGSILMIAPLRVDRFGSKVRMLCDMLGAGKAGFLYSPALTDEQRQRCLDFFFTSIFPSKGLKLRRLDPESPEHRWLCERYGESGWSPIPCVALDCSEGDDAWMGSLSKSARQNLRTARNRASRDGIELELKRWGPGAFPEPKVFSALTRLYVNRLYSKYRKGAGGAVGRLLHRGVTVPFKYLITRYLKHDTRSMTSNGDAVTFALYGNGQLMATMSGFATADGSAIVVPRLAIDDRFSFYSPGCLLIAEAIRQTPGLKRLDLSRGTEKYKFDMGGNVYNTSSWIIPRDKR